MAQSVRHSIPYSFSYSSLPFLFLSLRSELLLQTVNNVWRLKCFHRKRSSPRGHLSNGHAIPKERDSIRNRSSFLFLAFFSNDLHVKVEERDVREIPTKTLSDIPSVFSWTRVSATFCFHSKRRTFFSEMIRSGHLQELSSEHAFCRKEIHPFFIWRKEGNDVFLSPRSLWRCWFENKTLCFRLELQSKNSYNDNGNHGDWRCFCTKSHLQKDKDTIFVYKRVFQTRASKWLFSQKPVIIVMIISSLQRKVLFQLNI